MKQNTHGTGRRNHTFSARFRCLLLLAGLLFGSFGIKAAAQTQTPKVSIEAQDTALSKVFQAIQQQTDYSIVYNTPDIDPAHKVSISAQAMPLPALLDKLFAGSGINYTIKDKHVVLSRKTDSAPAKTAGGGNFRHRPR